mgnify:CR=1 FL=1
MDAVTLLFALKQREEEITKDLLLPTKPQKGSDSEERPIKIYNQRLPDEESSVKQAPYKLNAVLTGTFGREPGERPEDRVIIRSVLCVYAPDGETGAMNLLNVMERIRIDYEKNPILDNTFELDLAKKIQTMVYPDDTAPYYMGEMVTEWMLPPVEREGWKTWLK